MSEILMPREKVRDLHARVKLLKPKLPINYKDILALRWPRFNTIKGGILLRDILAFRSSNEELTIILETIVSETLEAAKKAKKSDDTIKS